MKAYTLSTDDSDDGNRMVFANSVTKAKVMATQLFDDCSYMQAKAIREPLADKYSDIAVNNELQWENEKHQAILINEFGWKEI